MNLKDQIKLIEDAIKALDAVEEVVGGPLVSATRNKLYRRAKARYDEIENMKPIRRERFRVAAYESIA